jgi:uncharacterized protein YijF (DUF1287 family)
MLHTSLSILVLLSTLSTAIGQINFYDRLADSTLTLTRQNVQYDPTYFRIEYPNGDVPSSKGGPPQAHGTVKSLCAP